MHYLPARNKRNMIRPKIRVQLLFDMSAAAAVTAMRRMTCLPGKQETRSQSTPIPQFHLLQTSLGCIIVDRLQLVLQDLVITRTAWAQIRGQGLSAAFFLSKVMSLALPSFLKDLVSQPQPDHSIKNLSPGFRPKKPPKRLRKKASQFDFQRNCECPGTDLCFCQSTGFLPFPKRI